MRAGSVAVWILIGACLRGDAAEATNRSSAWGGAGLAGGAAEAVHLAAGGDWALERYLALGVDFSYSYLPLAESASCCSMGSRPRTDFTESCR